MRHFVLYHNEDKRGVYNLKVFEGQHQTSYNKRQTVINSISQILWIVVGRSVNKKKNYFLAAKLKPTRYSEDEYGDLIFWAEGNEFETPIPITEQEVLDSLLKVTANFIGYTEIKEQSIVRYFDELSNGKNDQKILDEVVYPDELNPEEEMLLEGFQKKVVVNSFERNQKAREKCIDYWGHHCSVCEMRFEDRYGVIGKDFIHVHHLKPISEIGEEYSISYKDDLRPVCPNCHSMLHKKNPPFTIEE